MVLRDHFVFNLFKGRGGTAAPRLKSSRLALPAGRGFAEQTSPSNSIVVLLRYRLQHSFSLASYASLHPPPAALRLRSLTRFSGRIPESGQAKRRTMRRDTRKPCEKIEEMTQSHLLERAQPLVHSTHSAAGSCGCGFGSGDVGYQGLGG